MATATLATLADFEERLAEVGLSVQDVATGLGMGPRLDVDRLRPDAASLVLVVTTYARNAKGERYFDSETGGAAVEVRRFFITNDWRLVVAPEQEDK